MFAVQLLVVVIATVLLDATAARAAPVGEEPSSPLIAAVWREQEMVFHYQNFTTRYSCAGLKSKVKKILEELGVRESPMVTAYGCAAPSFEASPVVNLKLRFASLQYAPDGNSGEPVAARWDEVDLSHIGSRFLDRGDCVLVERFRDEILPAFAHTIVRDRTTCIPHSRDGSGPRLRLRVLRPAPPSGAADPGQAGGEH